MNEHTGALYIKRAGKYLAYPHTGADVQQMQQTIKGLDRRTREYDELVTTLKGNQLTLQKKVEELDCKISAIRCEISCRIEHGADSNGHLEGLQKAMSKELKTW
jgi:chromosome segregation ATPase